MNNVTTNSICIPPRKNNPLLEYFVVINPYVIFLSGNIPVVKG